MNEHELELIRDYLDDRISLERLEQLNQLLESNDAARSEFRAMAAMEEGLRDLSVTNDFPTPLRHERAAEDPAQRRAGYWYRLEHIGVAVLLLICFGLATFLLQKSDNGDQWGDAIAKIDFLSKEVAFASSHQLPTTKDGLLGKGWMQLAKGRVRILFRSGVTVEMEGPAAIGIDTPMRAYLDFGKVTVHAPESGRDFVVATESMEVVDLGTRFEVSVDPQSHESKVTVIEGLVDLHLGSRGADRTIRPLEAGYAARVDEFGKIVEIKSDYNPDLVEDGVRILAHWTFDDIGTDGNIKDSTNNSLNGILRAGNEPQLAPGVSGKALTFTDNTSVDLSKHVSTLTRLEDFTLTAWVRDPVDPLAVLFSLSGDSEQHRVQFYLAHRFVRFGWQDGQHFDSISGRVDSWNSGQWYHVAITFEGGIARLYRNGELLASGAMGSKIGTPVNTLSVVKDASVAYLGRLEDGRQGEATAHQWFQGQMDDVQLYEGAVNQEGIRFMYEHPGVPWSAGKSPP